MIKEDVTVYVKPVSRKKQSQFPLIQNELLTEAEIRATITEEKAGKLILNGYAEWVQIPLAKTHTFFGCRFPNKEGRDYASS